MGNVVSSTVVGSTGSEILGATGFGTGVSTVGHGVGSGVGSLENDIGRVGIACAFRPVGEVLGLGVSGSKLHSGTSDGSGVRGIRAPGGVSAEGWVTTSAGGDEVDSPEDGISSS